MPVLPAVLQSDYETMLAALRDYIRIMEMQHQIWGVDEVLRLAVIRGIARTKWPPTAPRSPNARHTANRVARPCPKAKNR